MKRFLVFVELKSNSQPDAFATVARVVQGMSKSKCAMLHASAISGVMAVFVETDRAAAQIRSAIEGLECTGNQDVIFVMEVGQEFSAIGGSAAWTWLQHHGQKKAG